MYAEAQSFRDFCCVVLRRRTALGRMHKNVTFRCAVFSLFVFLSGCVATPKMLPAGSAIEPADAEDIGLHPNGYGITLTPKEEDSLRAEEAKIFSGLFARKSPTHFHRFDEPAVGWY